MNYITFKYRKVSYTQFPRINGKVAVRGKGRVFIGKDIVINSNRYTNPVGLTKRFIFHTGPKAQIVIGDNVGLSTSLLFARDKITIEDNVLIGGGCQILDNDFHAIDYEERVLNGDKNKNPKAILIKEGAFVGTACIVLKGVTIGARSVIAAGSVVVKDVPSNEIWGGNPAKFIKKLH